MLAIPASVGGGDLVCTLRFLRPPSQLHSSTTRFWCIWELFAMMAKEETNEIHDAMQ